MSNYIPKSVRELVATRAMYHCEYCQTSQLITNTQMHIEHILPVSAGGTSEQENLGYSCPWCNVYKGAKTHGIDPLSDIIVPLYNPRQQLWDEHFCWSDNGLSIIGQTPTGRVTVQILNMNDDGMLYARQHWVDAGWHPPSL